MGGAIVDLLLNILWAECDNIISFRSIRKAFFLKELHVRPTSILDLTLISNESISIEYYTRSKTRVWYTKTHGLISHSYEKWSVAVFNFLFLLLQEDHRLDKLDEIVSVMGLITETIIGTIDAPFYMRHVAPTGWVVE